MRLAATAIVLVFLTCEFDAPEVPQSPIGDVMRGLCVDSEARLLVTANHPERRRCEGQRFLQAAFGIQPPGAARVVLNKPRVSRAAYRIPQER